MFVGHYGTTRFDVSDNVACHVATEQLHLGGEDFLSPAFLIPKPGDGSSDDICIPRHTHSGTQGCSHSDDPGIPVLKVWAKRSRSLDADSMFTKQAMFTVARTAEIHPHLIEKMRFFSSSDTLCAKDL